MENRTRWLPEKMENSKTNHSCLRRLDVVEELEQSVEAGFGDVALGVFECPLDGLNDQREIALS